MPKAKALAASASKKSPVRKRAKPAMRSASAVNRNKKSVTLVMALSLTSSTERLSADWDGEVPQALRRAPGEISRRIGRGAEERPTRVPSESCTPR